VPNVKRTTQRKRSRRQPDKSPFRRATVVTPEPVRGIKLKTVSRLTLLFALACLGAFVAGRPPVAAEWQAPRKAQAAKSGLEGRSERLALRNDDARRVALRLRR
jgi:hypothetical protein